MKKRLKILKPETAWTRTYKSAQKPPEQGASLPGEDMQKSEKVRFLERRLLTLRQLSEARRCQLREARREQETLLFSEKGGELQAKLICRLSELKVKVSAMQQQTQALRERIQLLFSPLQHLSTHPLEED